MSAHATSDTEILAQYATAKIIDHPGVARYDESRELLAMHGMEMPVGDLEAVRAVAAWINEQRDKGWGVPFLSVHGLLLRYPADDDDRTARFHYWLAAGDPVLWDGNEFTQRWGLVRSTEQQEAHR